MTGYDLPVSVDIGGASYPIRSDYRAVLNVLCGLNDPDLDQEGRVILLLKGMYPGWTKIPPDHVPEALKQANNFIDCGRTEEKAHKPRTIDWEQDSTMIIAAVNGVAHEEIRSLKYLHWWTFFSYFLEVRKSLLSDVISIRLKKAKGKKLEKWEQEFYRENRSMIDLKRKQSASETAEIAQMQAWLDKKLKKR